PRGDPGLARAHPYGRRRPLPRRIGRGGATLRHRSRANQAEGAARARRRDAEAADRRASGLRREPRQERRSAVGRRPEERGAAGLAHARPLRTISGGTDAVRTPLTTLVGLA